MLTSQSNVQLSINSLGYPLSNSSFRKFNAVGCQGKVNAKWRNVETFAGRRRRRAQWKPEESTKIPFTIGDLCNKSKITFTWIRRREEEKRFFFLPDYRCAGEWRRFDGGDEQILRKVLSIRYWLRDSVLMRSTKCNRRELQVIRLENF